MDHRVHVGVPYTGEGNSTTNYFTLGSKLSDCCYRKFDLYSKTDETPDMEALKIYYQSLIDKHIPGKIKF